ncbi:G-type lectin S-receptor-like serine/threonine-protein kinase At1g34300 [Triticum dicoccoides]|uniref:G-type lectin S-receptor-like serine/threonine-protein kinase At1g34300 n=1 Tax=Triticum dicoccoides TaxID=85692 RepID=UPI00162D8ABA|nr:G-type lectin S-receptor-like serine/threonine-protein kinase At1g34300 [Triticum dicoccoides]
MQIGSTSTCISGPCPKGLLSHGSLVVLPLSLLIAMVVRYRCIKRRIAIESAADQHYTVVSDQVMMNATVERFVLEMADEKPIRFTPEQLAGYTRNYSARLGAGGFGTVYRGELPNGLAVAVKLLHPGLDTKTSEEQFMAEMGTIGRTHHINLVRLYGFCFDADSTRALVYEFMDHGSLDDYLSSARRDGGVSMPTVAAVATGVARGLRYLHEECQHKIVHQDIKPGNVLLGGAALTPKLADFGLARLVNRADTHVSLSHGGGTPGYAAPEVWLELRITEKCDVYSFGMLLLKILEHASNHDADAAPESSRQWFPMAAWTRYEAGELMELVVSTIHQDPRCRELAEMMIKVAFWCAQQRPSERPSMSAVVKMLEGETEIAPPPNPFQYLMGMEPPAANLRTTMASSSVTTSNHIISF